VVLVGTGPELLLHARQLLTRGARLLAVADTSHTSAVDVAAARALAGSGPSVGGLLATWATLGKRGIPRLRHQAIEAAVGETRVRSVRLRATRGTGTTTLQDVDALCVAFGRQPASEIAFSTGALWQFSPRLGTFVARRDALLRLSVRGLFVAGAAGGVAQGSAWAAAEGALAGTWTNVELGLLSVEAARAHLRPVMRTIRRQRRLARLARGRDARRVNLLEWATPATIVCRCEGVTLAELQAAALPDVRDPNCIKGPTSAAMGVCLGRTCETTVALSVSRLRGEPPAEARPLNVRPPFRTIPLRYVACDTPPPERIQLIPGA
jgi:hypothetical protein